MGQYVLRRSFGLVPIAFGVTLLVFVLMRALPGDPAVAMLDARATPEAVAQLREDLGLEAPLFWNPSAARERGFAALFDAQYPRFLAALARGDLGRSFTHLTPVADTLRQRFPATLELALCAMALGITLGLPLGILAALHRGRPLDTLLTSFAVAGQSLPVFWFALLLVSLFALQLGWLPPSGRLPVDVTVERVSGLLLLDAALRGDARGFAAAARHLALPALTLAVLPLAVVARMTRSALLDVLAQDYVRTARSKGLTPWRVIGVHALRPALLPVLTVTSLAFGSLLTGAVLTETIYAWPGIGRWMVDAIAARDYPVVQGGVLFAALLVTLLNLVVDVAVALIDPRVQVA